MLTARLLTDQTIRIVIRPACHHAIFVARHPVADSIIRVEQRHNRITGAVEFELRGQSTRGIVLVFPRGPTGILQRRAP